MTFLAFAVMAAWLAGVAVGWIWRETRLRHQAEDDQWRDLAAVPDALPYDWSQEGDL